MRLYILEGNKIVKFDLPQKMEEYFLIKHKFFNNVDENTITVVSKNEKWYINSNVNVNIISNNSIVQSELLNDYSCYYLKVLNIKEKILLYAMPTLDRETYKCNISNVTSIPIGTAKDNYIIYNDNMVKEHHALIKLENGVWYINNIENSIVYVNDIAITKQQLKLGDIIFVNGLKIIWMNTFIKINNPNRKLMINSLFQYSELDSYDILKVLPVTEEEHNVSLYTDDEYFYHTPRIKNILEKEEIEIESPPPSPIIEDIPIALSFGTSLAMAATSLVSAYRVFSNISNGRSTLKESIPSIVLCVATIIGTLVMPKITTLYQRKRRKSKEEKRQVKYKQYLKNKENEINLIITKQLQNLNENNPTTQECINILERKNRMLWSREINHDDFCKVRLGIGSIPPLLQIKSAEKKFTLDEDNLFTMAYDMVSKYKLLANAPVTISFTEKKVLSFVCQCSYKDTYINNLILQLAVLQSCQDLKIVIFTDEKKEDKWEYTKILPHCWSDDKSIRFYATNAEEIKDISSFLEDEYKNRKESTKEKSDDVERELSKELYKKFSPYYMIITDNYRQAKNTGIIDMLLKATNNLGFSLMVIGDTMKELPSRCNDFVELCEKESCTIAQNINSHNQQIFINETLLDIDMYKLSTKLANIPTTVKDGISVLPQTISFLEMYGLSKIEQLNINNRWKNNNPVTSLAVPVGVHADGEQFKLDLHEKFHGPHGLIAGSTGSGKSEFIITYILSMACNFHPYEVQFVLIDYKGGGLAGAFENKESGVKIPHLAGTITNLDTAEMNRTLVSIKSELKRRQIRFNEVKEQLGESTIDIYKYQKFYREGLIKEPMAHLIIITDEFAELKSQQPEFLQELVTTARIGRSLGVHLILATQKPSGVVNDQIWSNSKFKICLKVQERSDSMEMLKRPEAASIKDVGRFYLQVGYDDYFDIGQSGWGGAKYIPTDYIIKKIDDSMQFVNNVGNVIKSINDEVKKDKVTDLGDQLTNIVKYIYDLSTKENIISRKLWLDAIPEYIYIDKLKTKYNYKPKRYVINPIIGEYDNPKEQEQGLLNLMISQKNTIIWGENGSGKENLLTTILYSSMIENTPYEINYYVIDCGSGVLKIFNKMPHIGKIAGVDDGNGIMDILRLIDKKIDERKKLFEEYAGNYHNYIENSGKTLPIITLVINNYEIFCENYSKIGELLTTLYRDGPKYGISFIISCITTNSLRSRVAQYFDNKLALKLPDSGEYRSLINAPKGLTPANFFGRGLVAKDNTAYEFQTAYICDKKNISKLIQAASIQLSNYYSVRAEKINSVPNVVYLNMVIDKIKGINSIPIGYEMSTKNVLNYNFTENKINLISAKNIKEKISFITAIIKEFKALSNINIKVIDFLEELKNIKNVEVYREDFNKAFAIINNEIVAEKGSANTNIYILLGVGNINNKLSNKGKEIFRNIFSIVNKLEKTYFILVDNYASMKNLQIEDFWQTQVNNNNGIWLGEDIGVQMIINVTDLQTEDRKVSFQDMGFVVNNGNHVIIKHIVDNGEENER